MATFNGARFIAEQLDSIRRQSYPVWDLVVSDDHSNDGTVAIVQQFAATVPQEVTIVSGPAAGFWKNFESLVRREPAGGDLFAFCDQDDVWAPTKLDRAISWFRSQRANLPALYFTRTELISEQGEVLGQSPLFRRLPGFRNALVQNIGGGNTMVFNGAARDALRCTPPDVRMIAHDWWAYKIVTGVGGVAYYDPWPSLKYRQHDHNLFGSNVGARARLDRLIAFLEGRFAGWNDINTELLLSVRDYLAPGNVVVLNHFIEARRLPFPMNCWHLARSGVYRQRWFENVGLWTGLLLRRV